MNDLNNSSDKKIEHPFKVPNNYFDNLESSILEKIEAEPKTEAAPTIPLYKNRKLHWAVLVAASVSLMAIFKVFLPNSSVSEGEIAYLTNVSDDEIIEYIGQEYTNLDEEELKYLYDQTDLSTTEISLEELATDGALEEEIFIEYEWIDEY